MSIHGVLQIDKKGENDCMSLLKYLFRDLQRSVECYEWYARKGFGLGNENSCLETSKGCLSSVNRKNHLNAR